MKSGRFEEAGDTYRDALRMRPADDLALAGLGDALAAQGRHREAADAYRHLRIVPTTGAVHHSLGVSLAAESHRGAAIESLSRAVQLEPDAPNHRLALAAILIDEGRLADALEQYRYVLGRDPGNADAQVAVGGAHTGALRAGGPDKGTPKKDTEKP